MAVKRGYRQTEAGVMPEDWSFISLGQFVALRRGHDLTERERRSGTVPVMGSAGQNGFHNRALMKGPGIILGRSGASFGQAHFCEDDYWPHNTALYVTDFFGNLPLFTYFFLKFFDFSRHNSGGAQQSLNRNFIAPIMIAVPSPAEQEAIAEALSDADALIESLEQLLAKKRLLKQGAMQDLLTGKRRLPGFEVNSGYQESEVGLIPRDWRIESIENISRVGRGRVISHKEIAKSYNPKYPVYSSQTSENGIMGWIDTFQFDGEFITWTTDGANAGTVFHRTGRFNCTNVCGTLKLNTGDARFVAGILGRIAPKHVSRHLGNPKLMNDVVKRIKIPYPSNIAEQTDIATILSDMDAEIGAVEAKLAKARQIKQGMMQELLTGRIRLV